MNEWSGAFSPSDAKRHDRGDGKELSSHTFTTLRPVILVPHSGQVPLMLPVRSYAHFEQVCGRRGRDICFHNTNAGSKAVHATSTQIGTTTWMARWPGRDPTFGNV